jgi:hypothetical protein
MAQPDSADVLSATPRKNGFRWLRVLLSFFLVYHLFVIIVVPNREYYLGQVVNPWIDPYVNFFELTNRWSFFAPEPGPPPVFIEWELLDEKGEVLGQTRWPDTKNPYLIRERENRRLAAVEYMLGSDTRVEKMMMPYLCEHYPQARSIRLWRLGYTTPGWNEVVKGERRIGDDVNMDRQMVSLSFCEGRKQ